MKNTKRIIIFSLIILLTITNLDLFKVDATYKMPFEPNSEAVLLINTDTNTVVYEKNSHKQMYPASLTKIMTAIIALETVSDLNVKIKAPPYIYDELFTLNVSHADIRPNEEVRMIDLLYAIILPSACEASSIIADYIGEGNITEFVELMNKKAKEIGAKDTVFKNAHGLFHEKQVTTAYDMYLITKYALSIPMFEKIATTQSYQMPATNKHEKPYSIYHTNKLMNKLSGGFYYEYAKGIKTGTLDESGSNLISMASKDGYNYLLITMGAPNIDPSGKRPPKTGAFEDAKNIYKWAFSSFKQMPIVSEGEVVGEVPVKLCSKQDYVTLLAKKDITALLPADSNPTTIQRINTLQKDVRAPIKKGDVLGQMDMKLNNSVIASVELVASEDLHRNVFLYSLDLIKRFTKNILVKILLVILFILIILFMISKSRYKQYKRKQNARNRIEMKHK